VIVDCAHYCDGRTDHDASLAVFLIWGVGSLIVSLVALAFFFKRRGWFEAAEEPAS
jgi:hypothetical protein